MRRSPPFRRLSFVILLLGWLTYGHAAEVGKVTHLVGTADVTRGAEPARPLAIGAAIHEQDALRTKSRSVLEVTLADGSRITLAESSRVVVAKYLAAARPEGFLEMTRGRLRAIVTDFFSRNRESFKVKTPTAVVGVQGTDFAVIIQPRHSRVLVYEGTVAVANADPGIPQRQILHRNETTIVQKGQPPAPPENMPAAGFGSGGAADLRSGGEQGADPTSSTSTVPATMPMPATPTPPGR